MDVAHNNLDPLYFGLDRFLNAETLTTITDLSLSEAPSDVLLDAGISEDAVLNLSKNVVLSEVTSKSTVISTYQNKPIHRTRKHEW